MTAQSLSDFDLLEALADHEARESFFAFRQRMHPERLTGWFQRDLSNRLQGFYEKFEAGERPQMILCTPPQHGKSWALIDFIAWCAGKNPDLRKIFASFSERLGIRANLALQRIYDSQRYQRIFPGTLINSTNVVTVSGQVLRNREILEYVDRGGYFRNTTVRGPVTGESLDLGFIDDPIKGREEARSEAVRNNTWDWLMDDVFSRFSEYAALLMILTRWHLDDPAGRLLEQDSTIELVRYPAIADSTCELMESDPREPGSNEPLFPELKSYDFLMQQKARRTEASWQSLFQQNPVVIGGDMFPVDRFNIVEHGPQAKDVLRRVRYWDKAGTDGGGKRTAGVQMTRTKDGRYYIEDVVKGQWSALDRESRIKQTASVDGYNVSVWVEQEPGSGGKESAESTIRNLAGFKVLADKVTGDKETRAEPYAAQVQGGNIYLVRGQWNRDFISEHEAFPNGHFKDQVDAAAGAFIKLSGHGAALSSWV